MRGPRLTQSHGRRPPSPKGRRRSPPRGRPTRLDGAQAPNSFPFLRPRRRTSRPDHGGLTEAIRISRDFDDVLRGSEQPVPASTRSARPQAPRRSSSKPPKRRKRGPRIGGIVLILLVLALVVGGGWWAVTNSFGDGIDKITGPQDYPGPGNGSVEVTVDPGDLGTTIGNRLYDLGVVKSVEVSTNAFNANKLGLDQAGDLYPQAGDVSGRRAGRTAG